MIGVLATLKVRGDKHAEFEAAFAKLRIQVRAQEHGNLLYQLAKSRAEPDTYKVFELYADEQALKTHGETDYFKAIGAELAPLLAAPMVIEQLDTID